MLRVRTDWLAAAGLIARLFTGRWTLASGHWLSGHLAPSDHWSLICSSEGAIETFIAHCDVAARDLLMPHCDSVIVLSTVLRIRRTLDGVEIDRIIGEVEAQKALAVEQQRRCDCRSLEISAGGFQAEYRQSGETATPQPAHD